MLDIDPDYTEALLNRAALLISAGELDAAGADIVHGLSVRPDHSYLWSAKGLLRSEQGAEDEALECYATALTLSPDLVEVYGNRAVLHFAAGRTTEAVADLDRAIALRDTTALRVNRGIGLQALGNDQAAIQDFDAALARPDVNATDVLFRRGLSHHTLGDRHRASADRDRHLRKAAEQGEVSEHADQIAALRLGNGDDPPGQGR